MKTLLLTLLAAVAVTAQAATVTGAGATFPAPVYAKWAEGYQKATGNQINYQSIGSGGGIKQINNKTVMFGASDVAVSQEDLNKNGQIQFPMVKGGVVAVVNIPGVENNSLNLTSKQLADIFQGKIKNWREIDSRLPDLAVTIAARADSSGTTAVFTEYLASVSPEFKNTIGVGKSVKWQGTVVNGKGNAGVAAMVSQVKGTIGYVEYAFAKQNNLPVTKVNGVAASLDTFKSDQWPITAETFIIVYPTAETREAIKFFEWAYGQDQIALDIDYVPLSSATKAATRALWKKHGLQ